MFAYCLNNPVNYADHLGYLPYFGGQTNINATLYGSNDSSIFIVYFPSPPIWGPIEPPEDAEPGTVSFGITGTLSFIVGGSGSVGITFDKSGNIGLILSLEYSGGPMSAGVGVFKSETNCPNIYAQEGLGLAVGVSGTASPVGFSVDGSMGLADDLSPNGYYGYNASVSCGIGFPIDVHGSLGRTWVYGFNIYEAWNNFYYWATQ